MKWLVAVIIASLIILFSILQGFIFGINSNFAESLITGLIGNAIMLIPTVLILDKLIKRHNEKAVEKAEKERYKNTLNTRHNVLVNNLETAYLHYVTKKPVDMSVNRGEFVRIVENLDKYIDGDFLKGNYKMVSIGPDGLFDFRELSMRYQDFFVSQFRDNIYKMFNEYVGRYVIFIPEEVLKSVFTIEDTLKKDVFTVPNDFAGVNLDISNAKFNPEDFIDPIREIGKEIIKLREYLD